jgi:hypothetical protein
MMEGREGRENGKIKMCSNYRWVRYIYRMRKARGMWRTQAGEGDARTSRPINIHDRQGKIE